MFKKVIAVAVLLFASVTPVQAEDLSYLGRVISWEDTAPFHDYPVAYSFSGGSGNPCDGGWSATCDPSVGNVQVVNFLPVCDSADGSDKRLDCVESVYADVNGVKVKGERVVSPVGVWNAYAFTAKPEFGIAKSSPILIYKFPGLSHDKGDNFMVDPFSTKSVNKGVVGETQYTFLIAPAVQTSSQDLCGFIDASAGYCWKSGSFLSDTGFTLNLKLATPPVGWFTSRITTPDVQINPASDGRTQVTFSGNSQAIPSISRYYHYTIQSEQDEWNQVAKTLPGLIWDKLTADGKRYSISIPFSSDAISEFQDIVSKVPSFNNADALKNIWRIESKSFGTAPSTPCLKSGFTGIVSSNALTYENAIPTWDAANSALVYRIASPHTALGKEFTGKYDLLISEQVGKCLWHVQNLSPSAEISVTSADGQIKVFTAGSSISGGFYKFTATGFTFSTNKISVKLVSKAASAPVGKPIAATKSSAAKTIICFKGKIQKNVTAAKPQCPTGYKKK